MIIENGCCWINSALWVFMGFIWYDQFWLKFKVSQQEKIALLSDFLFVPILKKVSNIYAWGGFFPLIFTNFTMI